MKSPTTVRVEAIAEHMESFGGYTQADEIRALGAERDRLRVSVAALIEVYAPHQRKQLLRREHLKGD